MEYIDIATGSLYRLEGWLLVDDEYRLSRYREQDPDWEEIRLEGLFLDPTMNTDLPQVATVSDYVAAALDHATKNQEIKQSKYYILFMIPQECDSIEAGDAFPKDFNAWTAYPESDCTRGIAPAVQTFICHQGRAMKLENYLDIGKSHVSWDDAVASNPDLYLLNKSDVELFPVYAED
jgi:hypothetical protein